MGENLMRIHHRKQILRGVPQTVGDSALQRGLTEIIRDSEQRERKKDKDGESIEMRLLAEQLSRRLETKYERNHEIEKERERNETERRLKQIGESYEREIRAKEKNIERERSLMAERMTEKEKKMLREVELKMADRESRLELERRRMESRLDELMNGKEELDRARKELMTTVENEMERLRHEKESLQERERRLTKDEKMNSVVERMEEERQRSQGRIAYLEATVSQLKERLHKSDEEKREAHANISHYEATKAELIVAKNNYLRQLEESRRLGEKLRERDDYEEMRMEIERLKIELRSSRRKNRTEDERERVKSETMEKLEIESTKNKEKELKIIISMMSEKIRGLTTERDYLRKECRELRKERMEEKKRENMKKLSEMKEDRRIPVRRHFSSVSEGEEGEEDESVITSLSSFEEDINNIKRRINKIDTLSHELEETLNTVCILPAAERIVREKGEIRSGEDDDYSPLHYSIGETREDTVVREKRETTVPPLTPSPPINRYESMERQISDRRKDVSMMEANHAEVTRISPPRGEKTGSLSRIEEEKKEKTGENNSDRKDVMESVMNMEGIDPVMAHYMKLVMEGRKNEKEEVQVAKVDEKDEEEIEEFQFDTVDTGGNDEGFEW